MRKESVWMRGIFGPPSAGSPKRLAVAKRGAEGVKNSVKAAENSGQSPRNLLLYKPKCQAKLRACLLEWIDEIQWTRSHKFGSIAEVTCGCNLPAQVTCLEASTFITY
jgi:hypothetical protein